MGEESVVPASGQGESVVIGICQPIHFTSCYSPRVAELLEGKGNGKAGRFQGKATKLQCRDQAEALVRSFFSCHT